MNNTFKVMFNVKNLGLYGLIPGLKAAMQNELLRVYHIYAEKCNSGVTEQLNNEFENLYPNYFKENADKEWYDLTEYNCYMAEGYQRLVVDELNSSNASSLLDFYVDSEEIAFTGRLKTDHNVTIEFYLKEVEA